MSPFIPVVALLAGGALVVGIFAIWGIIAEAEDFDEAYRDRPPLLYRLTWPLIRLIAAYAGWTLTTRRAQALSKRLRQGGQDYALTAEQFWAGKMVSALAGGFMLLGFARALDNDGMLPLVIGGVLGFMYPDLWLSEQTKRRNLQILKALPFFLDIVILSVESGLNLSGAMSQAVAKCRPGPLIYEMNRVLRDVRAGRPRLEALRELADRLDFMPISSLVSALVQGEMMGSSLGPILRAQSDQRRVERFQRAEKLAMEAPVKMLAPLIMFIFPCTFVILGFPIVLKFLGSGM